MISRLFKAYQFCQQNRKAGGWHKQGRWADKAGRECQAGMLDQGTLTEEERSVQLTSSLRYLVL